MCLVCCHRHYKEEADIAEINWRVRWDDIMFGAMEKRNVGAKKLERSGSRVSLTRVSLTFVISVMKEI